MKRSEALAVLSRDHHQALAVALPLRRATAASLDGALAGFHDYFDGRGERHFDAEEEVLLPVLRGVPDGGALADRIVAEHEQLRRLAADAGSSTAAAVALGDALHDHVRFEEREVFPLIEQTLGDDELAALGERLRVADA